MPNDFGFLYTWRIEHPDYAGNFYFRGFSDIETDLIKELTVNADEIAFTVFNRTIYLGTEDCIFERIEP